MSTLERAIALAATAHAGQRDKAGAPYIFHPLRMMLKMKTPEAQMASVLHDVVEDCGITPAILLAEGFSSEVVEAVGALTKRIVDGVEEPYEDFIRRVVQNPIARLVKLADLEDNMDLSRIAHPTEKDFARIEKYRAAKCVLEQSIVGDSVTDDASLQAAVKLLVRYGWNAIEAQVGIAAKGRCEYCDKPLFVSGLAFYSWQTDHIVPVHAGGSGEKSNLALACWHCNMKFKGTWNPSTECGENASRSDLIDAVRAYCKKRREGKDREVALVRKELKDLGVNL